MCVCVFVGTGNFFASNACVAIISTYRLLPTAKHPDGANDAVAAIKWTLDNAASYGGLVISPYPPSQRYISS